jgi:hypothetical protein
MFDFALQLLIDLLLIRWILANANWLISHSGTSYSDTAAAVGLGPNGWMERMDFLHHNGYYTTSYRINWESNECEILGAVDMDQAKKCPNLRHV